MIPKKMVIIFLALVTFHSFTESPENALSLKPLSLFSNGIALQYERSILQSYMSLAGGLGWRSGAGGDFDSNTYSITTEAKWWIWGKSPFSTYSKRVMIGPYISGQFELDRVLVYSKFQEKWIGDSFVFRESLGLGWRFAYKKIELSPSLSVGIITNTGDGFITSSFVPLIKSGLTLGWMF